MFTNRDPRRVQPLVTFVIDTYTDADWNTESSFDAIKVLSIFRTFYEGMGWKSSAWVPDAVQRAWPELTGEHDDVRAYISELLVFAGKTMWKPKPSKPTVEVFVRECRTTFKERDIMGIISDGFHLGRIKELVKSFKIWKDERLPGVRAFQSTYDKCVDISAYWSKQIH
jgi:proteasome activator subunit 4